MSGKRSLTVAVAAVVLLAGACANDEEGGIGGGGLDYPTGSAELVLRVEHVGGFLPVELTVSSLPAVSIYGDGRMIVQGPVIEIYPGPALPNLQVTRLSEDGLLAILDAARDAGLLRGNATYGYPCVADAATTRFTVTAEGRTSVVEAYALGLEAGDCRGDVDIEARAKLLEFQTDLGDLRGWLPQGSVGQEEAYSPAEMRVYVQPYRGAEDLPQPRVDWPLVQPLPGFGEPIETVPEIRCGVVAGDDFSSLLREARRANQLTPWMSGGEEFGLIFRPLLPDEHTC